jgi:8-oxo-dGTP diphosphatase
VSAAAPPPLHVVAGALVDARGRVLITERPAGRAFAGRWEFPGGKLASGEAPRAALARELAEELGIELLHAVPLLAVTHRYPGAGAPVLIDCWRVEAWRGEPAALDRQRLRWCTREELAAADILEADRAIVTALVLPRVFVHVGPPAALAARVPAAPGARERTAWLVDAPPDDAGIVQRLAAHGDLVFVGDRQWLPAGGVGHLYTAAQHAGSATGRHAPEGRVVHAAAEAEAARAAGADFLLVPEPLLPPGELRGIAAAGLPWYLDAAAPGAGGQPAPTGRLRWQAEQPIGGP